MLTSAVREADNSRADPELNRLGYSSGLDGPRTVRATEPSSSAALLKDIRTVWTSYIVHDLADGGQGLW